MPTSPTWADAVSLSDLVTTIVWLAAAIGFLWKGVPGLRRLGRVLDMMTGNPGDPSLGIAPVPGFGERLAIVEKASSDAAYHSKPNGGGSAYDKLYRKVDEVSVDVGRLSRLVEQHDRALSFMSADEPEEA